MVPHKYSGKSFAISIVKECDLVVCRKQIGDYRGLAHPGTRAFRPVLFADIIVGF
jgi:hypothetical protein